MTPAMMLHTKQRRIWLVASVVWVVLVFALFSWDYLTTTSYPYFMWPGFLVLGFVPVAIGWGLFVGLPAMLRWIRAGK